MEYYCEKCEYTFPKTLVFMDRKSGELMHPVGYSPNPVSPFAGKCGPVKEKEE